MKTDQSLIPIFCLLFVFLASSHLCAQTSNSGPIAHYNGDDTVEDISGNDFHGEVNDLGYTSDRFNDANRAYNFDGSNDYFQVSNLSANMSGDPGAITFWVKINSTSSNEGLIGTNGSFGVEIRKRGRLSVNGFQYSSQSISAGIWSHIAIVQTGSGLNCYINGSKLTESNTSTSWLPSDTNKRIEIGKDGSNYFPGSLDDIRFYNRALTDSEVLQLADIDNYCTEAITIQNPIITSINCNNPSGSFSINGEIYENGLLGLDSYMFTFYNDVNSIIQSKSTESSISGLFIGNYSLLIENSKGCTSDSISFEIEGNITSISIDSVFVTPRDPGNIPGKIEIYALILNGGSITDSLQLASYNFELWDSSNTSKLDDFDGQYMSGLQQGNYNVVVVDPVSNCTSEPFGVTIERVTVLPIASSFEYALFDLGYDAVIDGGVYEHVADTITILDVSNRQITSLEGLTEFPNLIKFYCQTNNIEQVDLSKQKDLQELNIAQNHLHSLNVNENKKLKQLIVNDNLLSVLDMPSIGSHLEELNCSNNQLTNLNLSECQNLTTLVMADNQFEQIELLEVAQLTALDCSNNQLVELDISSLANLTSLDATGNDLLACVLIYENQDANITNSTTSIDPDSEFNTLCPILSQGNGNWNDPIIWPGGIIPGDGERVRIVGNSITLNQAVQCQSVTIEHKSVDQSGQLFINNGGYLELTGYLKVSDGIDGAIQKSKVVIEDGGHLKVLENE
ncbi:MAG: LamG-like jellyroll fold domain-containing protein [Reichenbachiella sp.]|uniref:LamG-like jellyroll fold domain-containing protein n=1 Tax=Reichenbachiella sp. TaxID=2184521 RepID=UPI003299E9DD